MILRARDRTLELAGRPLVMGILNATPDSFSDGGAHRGLEQRKARAAELIADGADLLDIGGESNVTNRPPVPAAEEIERVVPLIRHAAEELGAVVSVDTYKPEVAEAALEAGAHLVNDISGLADERLADLAARTGAGLVLMHTPVAPKTQDLDERRYADVAAEVAEGLAALARRACDHGVAPDQLLLDPGPDFGKTPAQTVAVLRDLPRLAGLGRPLLLAVSRKDFIGAIAPRRPSERGAGTLAAVAHAADAGVPAVLRVHDVRATVDFLAVRAVLRGEAALAAGARVPDELRREPPADR